jgi:molecular chaperone GrpE
MAQKEHENNEEFEDITDEMTDTAEPELEDIEDLEAGKLKKLKEKLRQAEDDKRKALEELASVKADYLNARKRLEEDAVRTIERKGNQHLEDLLPLADSFAMAMSNKEVWEKADENWRKGIEGIYAQLLQILRDGGVESVDPTGEQFDPNLHEAISTQEVTDDQVDEILSVMQLGYQIVKGDQKRALRPARVTIGVAK